MKKRHATLKALCNCNEEMIAVKRPIGFYRFSQCPRMAAGLLALAFLSPIAACSSKGSLDDLKNPTPSPSTSSSRPSASASIASDTPTWNFPVNLDGWRMDIIDRDGKNRAINSAGCYLTTSQHPIAGPLEGDREESEYQNERIATTLRSQLTNVQAQPASETRVSGFSGKKIEGAASEISYTGKDGVAYKGWYWSRVFGKIKTPVLLQSTYACPVQAYSAAELTSIINGKLSILSTASEDFDG